WQVEGPFGPRASTPLAGGPGEAETSPLAALAVLAGGGVFTALLLFLYSQMRRAETGAGPNIGLPPPGPSRSATPPPAGLAPRRAAAPRRPARRGAGGPPARGGARSARAGPPGAGPP